MKNFDPIDILFIILISCYLVTFIGIVVLVVLKFKDYKKNIGDKQVKDKLEHFENILATPIIKNKKEVMVEVAKEEIKKVPLTKREGIKKTSQKKSTTKKTTSSSKKNSASKKKTTTAKKTSTIPKKTTSKKSTTTTKKKSTSTNKKSIQK